MKRKETRPAPAATMMELLVLPPVLRCMRANSQAEKPTANRKPIIEFDAI